MKKIQILVKLTADGGVSERSKELVLPRRRFALAGSRHRREKLVKIGEVPERSNGTVLKTVEPSRVP